MPLLVKSKERERGINRPFRLTRMPVPAMHLFRQVKQKLTPKLWKLTRQMSDAAAQIGQRRLLCAGVWIVHNPIDNPRRDGLNLFSCRHVHTPLSSVLNCPKKMVKGFC